VGTARSWGEYAKLVDDLMAGYDVPGGIKAAAE
jgi:hypothetical protein